MKSDQQDRQIELLLRQLEKVQKDQRIRFWIDKNIKAHRHSASVMCIFPGVSNFVPGHGDESAAMIAGAYFKSGERARWLPTGDSA